MAVADGVAVADGGAVDLIFFASLNHIVERQHFLDFQRSANAFVVVVALDVFVVSFDQRKFVPLDQIAVSHAVNRVLAVVQPPAAVFKVARNGMDAALGLAVFVGIAVVVVACPIVVENLVTNRYRFFPVKHRRGYAFCFFHRCSPFTFL